MRTLMEFFEKIIRPKTIYSKNYRKCLKKGIVRGTYDSKNFGLSPQNTSYSFSLVFMDFNTISYNFKSSELRIIVFCYFC